VAREVSEVRGAFEEGGTAAGSRAVQHPGAEAGGQGAVQELSDRRPFALQGP